MKHRFPKLLTVLALGAVLMLSACSSSSKDGKANGDANGETAEESCNPTG